MEADPGYLANLMALGRVERERLLGGNWKVRKAAGSYFKRSDVEIIDVRPTDVVSWVRRWDLAATEPTEENPDPDWTAGLLMGKRANGRYVIADLVYVRKRGWEIGPRRSAPGSWSSREGPGRKSCGHAGRISGEGCKGDWRQRGACRAVFGAVASGKY
ncbi:hypothetical protein G6F68_017188 [Rhizopus microsporus]|nr:hypothetical protein G6F68_017188 [Rhizopus microsporus]